MQIQEDGKLAIYHTINFLAGIVDQENKVQMMVYNDLLKRLMKMANSEEC